MPADYCGGFTIDDIDQFGTLEQINVSFDDPVWESATTCIYYGDASVTASASVSASGLLIRQSSGAITGTATVSSGSERTRLFSGAITASSSVSADSIRLRTSSGQITGIATVTGLGGVEYSANASVNGIATVNANGSSILIGSGSISGIANVTCAGYRLGDIWIDEVPGLDTWIPIAAKSTIWTTQNIGN